MSLCVCVLICFDKRMCLFVCVLIGRRLCVFDWWVDMFGVGVFVSLTVDMFGQKKEGDDVWFGRCRPASHRLVPNTKMKSIIQQESGRNIF